MAEFNAGFRVYADATDFQRGMAQVTRSAQNVGKQVANAFDGRAIGRTLATALGLSLTDIADKVARFWTGFSKEAEAALEGMVAATGKAADAQEKALQKLRAQKEKEAEEEGKRINDQYEMIRDFRQKAAEEDAAAAKKEAEARKEAIASVAEFDERARFEKLSDEKKLAELRKEEVNLQKIIRDYEADVEKNGFDNAASAEALLELKQALAETQGKIAGLTKNTATAEAEVVAELEKQKALKIDIATIGKGDRELSDRELAKKAANLRADVAAREAAQTLQGGVFTGATTNDSLLNPQRANLARVMEEMALRDQVRRQARFFGEDKAFQNFGGSEQRFNDILQGVSESQELARKTADGIQELNNRLKAGIPVVNLNTK
jgi:hypothetical protein